MKYDLLILGATGFTGQFVVEKLVKTIEKNNLPIKWAIACRDVNKGRQELKKISALCRINLDHIPALKADVQNIKSMNDVFKKSTLVVNCVGPFSFLGENVVQSCLDSEANMIDLSGEPLYLEKMQFKYNKKAQEKKLCIVGSCGFDSVPADLGTQYLKREFNGRLNQVEHIIQIENHTNNFNYATWQSLIEGYKNRHYLTTLRKNIFQDYKKIDWPVKLNRKLLIKNRFGYCVPFPGSDRSVVSRTQMHRYTYLNELPTQFEAYFQVENLFELFKLAMLNFNLEVFSKFEWGERALLKYSRFFSFGMFIEKIKPRREELEQNKFKMTLVGRGWPHNEINLNKNNMSLCSAVILSGGDVGYIDTSVITINTALALLEKIKNKSSKFGVLSPGMALEPNEIIPNLKNDGIKIEFFPNYKSDS